MIYKNNIFLFMVSFLFSAGIHAASFDCTKAARAIDKAICNDSELSALDEKLAAVYAKEFAVNPDVKEGQREWLRSLKQCNGDFNALAACLKPMFLDRINYLEKQIESHTLQSASNSSVISPQQNANAVDQAKLGESKNNVKPENIVSKESKSSFGSVIVLTIIVLILAMIFMVYKKRKKVSEKIDKQDAPDFQKTGKVQTNAQIIPSEESKDQNQEVKAQSKKEIDKIVDRNTHAYLCADCGWHGNVEETNYDKEIEDVVCPECGSGDFEIGTFPAEESLYSTAQCGHCDWVGREDDCSRSESDELVCPSCGAEDDVSLRKLPTPGWFGNDRKLILRALITHGSWLKDIPSNLKDDKELALAAVKSPHLALKFASYEFQNNKEVVEAAINKWAAEFEYASEQMRDDQELALIAVSSSGYELQHASERLRSDINIVLAAVSESGGSLQFASADLQNNREVVMAAVMSQGSALEYASERLRADKDVVTCAVSQDGDAIGFAAPVFKKDKVLSKKAVENSYSAIQHVDRFIIDKELSLLAVTKSGWALEYLPDSFKDDEDIVLVAVNDVGVALQYATNRLRKNKKIVDAATANDDDAIEYSMLKRSPENSINLSMTISDQLNARLDKIIDSCINDEESLMEWRNSGGSYKVRPGYAYDKFYLNRITGNYDMSLQGLIHHMMYEEGLYKRFLNGDELSQVEECVLQNPEGIWGVADLDSAEGEQTQALLDSVYAICIKHVGHRLREASLDVTEFISEGYIEEGSSDHDS